MYSLSTVENCQFGFLRARFSDYRYKKRSWDNFAFGGAHLCHYTNLRGLVGILESGGFWISDFRFLNDTEEYFNGCRLATEMIKSALSRSRPRDQVVVSILESTIHHLNRNPKKTFFVCSFSEDEDSLEQWRAYATGNDGVCIIFNNKPPLTLSHFCILPIMTPQKVIYDDLLKRKILLRVVAKHVMELKNDIAYGHQVDTKDWSSELATSLSLEFLIFKNKAFSSEKEVRLVISESQLSYFKGVHHRVAKERIIPFVHSTELYNEGFVKHYGTDRLPISAIKIGPMAHQEITMESVKAFLNNMGYDSVPVIRSNVTYRG